jgi:hypothetical protein
MKDFAQDAVRFAQEQYRVKLDYSEKSIRRVEIIVEDLSQQLPRTKTGRLSQRGSLPKAVSAICNMFGGYIGEVLRKNYGGRWDIGTTTPDKPIIALNIKGLHLFPPTKVYKRLADGSEEDLWSYYRVFKRMLKKHKNP